MNVPKLRFSKYNEEWNKIDLANIFSYFSTNSLSREQLSFKGDIKNLHYGDIHKKFGALVDVSNDINTFIKDQNFNNKYELCKENDLVIADASEDYEGIGKATEVINIRDNKIISGLHTIMARDNKSVFSPKFKGYYFNSPAIHNQIRVLANGFKVFGISKDTINSLNAYIPSKEEQKNIADMLQLLDKKIELQSQKIEVLKLYKKGLLIYLFKNKICNKKLSECFKFGKAGGTPKSTNQEFYNGDIPFLSISDMSKQGKYISNTEKNITKLGLNNSSAWIVPKNSIIISMYASYGLVSINNIELSTSQAMFDIIVNDECINEYIYYYLYYLYIIGFYDTIVSTGTQSNLNAEQLKNLRIYVPNKIEQKNLSNKLIKFDYKLNLEIQILNKLPGLKKGLMQNMFV